MTPTISQSVWYYPKQRGAYRTLDDRHPLCAFIVGVHPAKEDGRQYVNLAFFDGTGQQFRVERVLLVGAGEEKLSGVDWCVARIDDATATIISTLREVQDKLSKFATGRQLLPSDEVKECVREVVQEELQFNHAHGPDLTETLVKHLRQNLGLEPSVQQT